MPELVDLDIENSLFNGNPLTIIDTFDKSLSTLALIEYFKTIKLEDYVYINIPHSYKATRAAFIATDGKANTFIHLKTNQEYSVISSEATLRSMGCGAFIISSDDTNLLKQTISEIAPYCMSNIGVFDCVICDELENVSFVVGSSINFRDIQTVKIAGLIEAPDSRFMHYISDTFAIESEIYCTSRLAEDIIAAEDSPGGLKIIIKEEYELSFLDEMQYMINRPLCIFCEDSSIYEKALAIYTGRSIYDGSFFIENKEYLIHKYGLLIL